MFDSRFREKLSRRPEDNHVPSLLRRLLARLRQAGAARRSRFRRPATRPERYWAFRFSQTGLDEPDGFELPTYDDQEWDRLPVPSHWQLHGYGKPAYLNIPYPIPLDPPFVPDENQTGDYRRVFDLPDSWDGTPAVVRFEGVDSCARVWLNGVELGVSRGSRLPVEFDASEALRPGRNVLAVRVHQYSSGTYLEDQDTWRLSGIFRDVALPARPVGGIRDVFVHADFDVSGGGGRVRFDVEAGAPVEVSIPLLGVGAAPATETFTFGQARPWSAEDPFLYEATLATPAEQVRVRFGFRTVAIDESGVLTVNGRRVVLRGVNSACGSCWSATWRRTASTRRGPNPGSGIPGRSAVA
ncbi:glycosyl hydrolase family 2 [Nonomuraea polychroma]|uniref:beta-galactosidase n=1 Tax=Nonomuraea polychroma TaxID=46176 RepID=A0A438M2F6_9ACTN|nr:glycosyl hydrolase family 2 [Nonomuraea polychroma]